MAKPKEDAKKADPKKLSDELAKLVRDRAGKMVAKMNAAFVKARAAAVKDAKAGLEKKLKAEAKDGKPDKNELAKQLMALEARIPVFSIKISEQVESVAHRQATEQAYYAIKNWSGTCSSAHMRRAAIHLAASATRVGKKKDVGTDWASFFPAKYAHADHLDTKKEIWAIMSLAEFKKAWATALSGAALANWGGTKSEFAAGDPWHVELPRKAVKGGVEAKDVVAKTRPGRADKEVQACVEHYADYVALTETLPAGKKLKRNSKIETNYKSIFDKKFKAAKAKVDAERKKVKEAAVKAAKSEAKDGKVDPKVEKAKVDEALNKLDTDLAKRAKKHVNKMNPDPTRFKLER